MTFLGTSDKSLVTSAGSSTPSSRTSGLEAQLMSLNGNHGSLRSSESIDSRTLVPTPRSSRQESRQCRTSHYEGIIRKYREIMDAFQNELRRVSAVNDDNTRPSSSGNKESV